MKDIRFIHTADLHLDSPFLGLNDIPEDLLNRIQESTFLSFQRIIDAAINYEVDFVVIAGDLFDGEDRSIKAQARLRKQMERLEKSNIHAFISHGNHDHLSGNSIILDMPDNVHIFQDKVEKVSFTTKNGVKVILYGFSYPERHVMERKVTQYHKEPEGDFHVALLHGHCESGKGSTHHQPYAPFTINELLEKDMDYWALGHIHKRQVLHKEPYIIYPGNIQGRHRLETGEKGCYFVHLTDYGTDDLEFIPTDEIRWRSLEITAKNHTSLTELYKMCMDVIHSANELEGRSTLFDLTISFAHLLHDELKKKILNDEFIEMLQESLYPEGSWLYQIKLESKEYLQAEKELDERFIGMLDTKINSMLAQPKEFEQAIAELYSHIYGSRYVDVLEEEEKEELLQTAKQLIISEILS